MTNTTGNMSLGEVEKLAKLAARGAGLSWGLADEAGKAVRWLEARGLPGASELMRVLGAQGAGSSAVLAGAWLCDSIDQFDPVAGHRVDAVDSPLLLLPFVALAAQAHGHALHVRCGAAEAVCATDAVELMGGGFSPPADHPVHVVGTTRSIASPLVRQNRVRITAKCNAALECFAARTYAPATDASRLLGAGGGDTDND